jgi:hypothetical protein
LIAQAYRSILKINIVYFEIGIAKRSVERCPDNEDSGLYIIYARLYILVVPDFYEVLIEWYLRCVCERAVERLRGGTRKLTLFKSPR